MTASIASAGAGPTASTVMEPGSTSVRPASLTTWVGSPSDEAWDSNARLVCSRAWVGVGDGRWIGEGRRRATSWGVRARVFSHIHTHPYHVMFWYTGVDSQRGEVVALERDDRLALRLFVGREEGGGGGESRS